MKVFIALLLSTCLYWGLVPCSVAQSLDQIRYEIEKNPDVNIMRDLRRLAERGDFASQQLLGEQLVNSGYGNAGEAQQLFKSAFSNGRGEITALASLARLLDTNKLLRKRDAEYIRGAIKQFAFDRDTRTLATALEVYLAYPEYFDTSEVERLLGLYKRSCLKFCRLELFEAVLAEQQGDRLKADSLYKKAIFVDTRAVIKYYNFLGAQQDSAFPEFVHGMRGKMNQIPVETVHRIATLLDSIYSTLNGVAAIEIKIKRDEELGLQGLEKDRLHDANEARADEQKKVESERNAEVLAWLDNAIDRNWVPAMASKVNNMTSRPAEYSGAQAMDLIDRIAKYDVSQAKALRVSVLLVATWKTLDPEKSYSLIQELRAENYPGAELLLGDLYSRGGLDEADQDAALAIYRQQAHQGVPSAFYRVASVYYIGKSICHDKSVAYAYAIAADESGEFRAHGFIKRLVLDMKKEEQERAATLYQELAKEYGL